MEVEKEAMIEEIETEIVDMTKDIGEMIIEIKKIEGIEIQEDLIGMKDPGTKVEVDQAVPAEIIEMTDSTQKEDLIFNNQLNFLNKIADSQMHQVFQLLNK